MVVAPLEVAHSELKQIVMYEKLLYGGASGKMFFLKY
jgi:hypothetical protein